MKKENIFYLAYLATILIVRAGVLIFPQRKIIIDGMIIHHFWIGLLVIFLALLMRKWSFVKLIAFAIGMGLLTDELTFMLLGAGTVTNYWSVYSVLGAIILAAAILYTKNTLLRNLFKD